MQEILARFLGLPANFVTGAQRYMQKMDINKSAFGQVEVDPDGASKVGARRTAAVREELGLAGEVHHVVFVVGAGWDTSSGSLLSYISCISVERKTGTLKKTERKQRRQSRRRSLWQMWGGRGGF